MSGVENSQTQSSQLKADANARFEERDFKAARDTYSKAIELDPTDATLYANRAQANLVLKDHEKALEDATKATELDPSSCKAWARKATAEQILARFRAAIISWKHALETLPPTNEMTDAQKLMRTECERGLAGTLQDATEAERRAKEDQAPPIDLPAPDANGQTDEANISSLPWDRAKVLLSDTTGKRIERAASSAWVILYAHQAFEKAMQGLGKLVQAETESGSTFNGEIGVLGQFVESVMRDPRAFYMEGPEFLEQYNHQVQFELSQTDGWFTDDVNVITREVQERAEAQGWDSVRLALSTTVNVWVMNGFLAQKVNQKPEDALDLLGRALGLIEWGRSALAQAGVQDPGPAFSEQYARSVKRFYFQAFMAAYMKKPGQDSEYSLDDLHGLLREYIKDITSKLPGVHKASASLDPSSVSSFWLYPMAEAYSNLGWIHFRRAVEGYVAEGDTGVEFNLASQFYIKAALGFDQDDEFYAYYLAEAVNALWNRQAPLLDVLPWCTKIIEAIPKMNAIWEWSQFRHARDPVLKQVLDFEETARTKLQSGELTVASRLLPEAPSNPEANPGEAPVVSRSRSY